MFELIKQNVNLVRHVEKYTQLRQSGRTLHGKCPLHEDDTPSFTVYPQENNFFCFGCNRGGSVIDFEVYRQGVSPLDAAKALCDEYNLHPTPADSFRFQQQLQIRKKKEDWLEALIDSFAGRLDIYEYVKNRGLSEATIKTFQLGAGGSTNVVVIPIDDKFGKVVGFARRNLDKDAKEKYLNDLSDMIYNKSEILYNFDRAKKYARDNNAIILNEGYFDVMSLWEAGIKIGVAFCSSRITRDQSKIINETLDENGVVYLVPTNDTAGQDNLEKNSEQIKILCPKNTQRVLIIPEDCKDLNDVLIKYGKDKIKDIFERTYPIELYCIQRILKKEERVEVQYSMVKNYCVRITNALVFDDLCDFLSAHWNKSPEVIKAFLVTKSDKEAVDISKFKTMPMLIADYDKYVSTLKENRINFGWAKTDMVTRGMRVGDVIQLVASSGVGKCLAKGTPVLMYDGSIKLVEDIVVGDILMGHDSTPRKILTLSRGREEMYRVVPIKGEPFTCNKSHILSLKIEGKIINISIEEFLQKNKTFRQSAKLWRVGVEFVNNDVNIEPYLLGIWLGDGTCRVPEISNPDEEIYQYLCSLSNRTGVCVVEKKKSLGKCKQYYLSGEYIKNHFKPVMKECLNIDGLYVETNEWDKIEKRIPKRFLINSREVRLQLLSGLLDTDGYLIHNCYEIVTKWDGMKDDIVFLARSLGLAVTARKKLGTIKKLHFEAWYWRIFISGDVDMIPCKIKRKQAKSRRQVKGVLVTGFSLQSVGVGDYYGFSIGGDRLFLLGDFTVTHNTLWAENLITNLVKNYPELPLMFFSLEQLGVMAFERFVMMEGQLESHQVEQWNNNPDAEIQKRIIQTIRMLAENYKNFVLTDEGGMTLVKLEQYVTHAGMMVFDRPVKIIVIDYMGYLHGEGKDLYHKISAISKELKELAKKLKCVIISLHQVSKAGKSGGDPIEAHMARDSGVVVESADIMISAWRPELKESITDAEKKDLEGIYITKIVKNRYGLSGVQIEFMFVKRYLKLYEKRDEPMQVDEQGKIGS